MGTAFSTYRKDRLGDLARERERERIIMVKETFNKKGDVYVT